MSRRYYTSVPDLAYDRTDRLDPPSFATHLVQLLLPIDGLRSSSYLTYHRLSCTDVRSSRFTCKGRYAARPPEGTGTEAVERMERRAVLVFAGTAWECDGGVQESE